MAKAKAKLSESRQQVVRKLTQLIGEKLEENIDAICNNASTENSARCSVAIRINDIDTVPHCFADVKWAKHFRAKGEFTCEDPNQGQLLKNDEEEAL